jgi:hypothetical protein
MKKTLVIVVLSIVLVTYKLSIAQPKSGTQKLEINNAALLMLSLDLAKQANQLYSIKDNLVRIVQSKRDKITIEEKYVIDIVSELKHIATIAYFESKLLGVALIIRKDLKMPFMNARIPELHESIESTESSLQPIQIAYSEIQNHEALQNIDQAKEILKSLSQLYITAIDILQKTATKKGAAADTQP